MSIKHCVYLSNFNIHVYYVTIVFIIRHRSDKLEFCWLRQTDLDQLREQLEEEQEGRSDLQRMLTKANNEMAVWRHKCESGEGGVRSEEMEELKRKMNAKIMELEAALEAAQAKASSMEKVKNRLQGELEDLTIEVERVRKIIL